MGRPYAAVPYASWPKPTSPQGPSIMHRFNIRSEILLPEIFPSKRPGIPISSAQRVLYDVSEPMSDIYGEEENVRPTSRSSRSSDETLQGDKMTPTSLNNGWNTLGQHRDHDAMEESPAQPHAALDHDGVPNLGRDSRQSSLDSRVQGPIKPHAAQSSDHDSELHQGWDSRRSSLDSQVQGPVNDMFRSSGMPNGMKRKRPCSSVSDSEDFPSSPPPLPIHTADDDPGDLSDWDQQYRRTMHSDGRRGSGSEGNSWWSSSQRSGTLLGQYGSQSQEYMMSGALADGEPNASTITPPDDLCVYDSVTSSQDCLCKSLPPKTEIYQGHFHIIKGITRVRGLNYFQCGVLCSEETVSVPVECYKSKCPNHTQDFLSQLKI